MRNVESFVKKNKKRIVMKSMYVIAFLLAHVFVVSCTNDTFIIAVEEEANQGGIYFVDDVEPNSTSRTSDTIVLKVSLPNATGLYYVFINAGQSCDGSRFTGTKTPFTSESPITISSDTNNGKYICATAKNASKEVFVKSAYPLNIDSGPL